VYALMLQLFGYVSSSTGEAATQDDTARLGVLLGFALVPAVLVGAAVLFLRRYTDDAAPPVPAAAASPAPGVD
jgi:Na+/melibiose symporter-like transporter